MTQDTDKNEHIKDTGPDKGVGIKTTRVGYCPHCFVFHDSNVECKGKKLYCTICNEPVIDPKANWRCINCAGELFYSIDPKVIMEEEMKSASAAFKTEKRLR